MGHNITRRYFLKQGLAGASLALTGGCAGHRPDLKADMDRLDQPPETRALRHTYGEAYDFDGWVECGQCLHGCIYKDLTEEKGAASIRKMRQGDVDVIESMLDQRIFCCPVDAHPAAFMLELLRRRRGREGDVPASLRYVINGILDHAKRTRPCFR